MNKKIIAVFGGAFNPPTKSHVELAKQILEKYENIEKIIFVPVSTKYNKKGLASNEDRLNMLQKICTYNKQIEVSTIEMESKRQPYTIETLSKIQNQNPHKDVCFILGTDNLKELETWHKAEELIATFKILVLKRDNDKMEDIIQKSSILREYKNSFVELNKVQQINLSSSYIREKIALGEDITGLVPEEIKNDVIKIYSKNKE